MKHVVTAFLVMVGAASSGLAHPIHTSLAEADYRAATGKLEIAIRLFTDDAEEMLTRQARQKITFAKTEPAQIDALLFAAVQRTFRVLSPEGRPRPLQWVGRELKDGDQQVWVYVTCAVGGGIEGARIAHGVLRDVFSDQINSVRVRDTRPPGREVVLLFTADEPQVVRFAGRKQGRVSSHPHCRKAHAFRYIARSKARRSGTRERFVSPMGEKLTLG